MRSHPLLAWPSAMDGADAVITTAAGYTRHSEGDTAEIDTTGNRNLVDAAGRAGIRRFVLTNILTCDQTQGVPHFWHKKLAEDRPQERGVAYVSLRPGAFLDAVTQMGGDPFAKGRLMWWVADDLAHLRPHPGPRRLPGRRGGRARCGRRAD